MPKTALQYILLSFLYLYAYADTWAVLIASSYGYWNYRHQADIFHAYHTLISNGANPDHIIVFAYDDVATDPNNPFPGQIFNYPSNSTPTDVYRNVRIDYKQNDVNPKNFLNVIKGNRTSGLPRVLNSTSQDNVFIYFSDHGVTGGLMFPGPNNYLWADNLTQALIYMHNNSMYKNLVFYLEACDSGSLFQNMLPNNINVYAVTASNSSESSWAAYCPPQDYINGTHLGTCLGDLFSINWLQNADLANNFDESLSIQYAIVKNQTNTSQVQRFGNFSIANLPIGSFEGNRLYDLINLNKPQYVRSEYNMNIRFAKYQFYKGLYARKPTIQNKNLMDAEAESMIWFDHVFGYLQENLAYSNHEDSMKGYNFTCIRQSVHLFSEYCGHFTEYGAQYIRNFAQFCAENLDQRSLETALRDVCG